MTQDVVRSPPNGITVLISGAGIGGLMTALECWRRGCEVQILERTKTTQTQGDSFTVGPTALNAFRDWPYLDRRNREIVQDPLFSYHDQRGELLHGPIELSDAVSTKIDASKRPRLQRHMRPDFHQILLEQLSRVGIEVEYDCHVAEYYEDVAAKRSGVVLKDGTKYEADIVVAADGLRGNSSRLITGKPVPAKPSGSAVFRVAYPVELALADPMIAERFKLTDEGRSQMEMWIGPNFNSNFWRNPTHMCWAIVHADRGTSEESWSQKCHPEEALKMTAEIQGWPEVADRVIKATPPELLVDWKIMWRDPQPKWTSPGGYVVQLGDAAHTFLPSSGNGATQALEDAISLATCISIAGKENIPDALRVHNLIRFERCSCLQAFGIANADARNTQKHDSEAKKYQMTFGKWIIDHDPEQYAKVKYDEALAHLREGKPFQSTNTPPGMVYRPWTIEGLLAARERGEPTVLDGDWS